MTAFLIGENNRAIVLTPRSASHSLAAAALAQWHPEAFEAWRQASDRHPAQFLPDNGWPCDMSANIDIGCVIRNPVERFRSMIAHRHLDVDEQLSNPIYGPLPTGNFARYFRFEDQLNEAAEWLGLPTPLPHEDATDEADKPTLTPEQEARVREIYADDILLWESLQ
jgi:hypothetical protein